MDRPLARRLAQSLKAVTPRRLRGRPVTFLPDFFIDHFVRFPSWGAVVPKLRQIHERGGGSFPHGEQRITVGGNAANVALAMARLGADVHLIAASDESGLALLRRQADPAGMDISRVRRTDQAAITTALEFEEGAANVLVSQAGPVDGFGPDALEQADWRLIERSGLVGVVNWALNVRSGTALADVVFRRAKKAGATTFFDSADPSQRLPDIAALHRRVLGSSNLDVWGLNENELRWFSSMLPGTNGSTTNALRRLRAATPARIDLHTRGWALSDDGTTRTKVVAVPIPRIERLTGAGDAWNAGNLAADLLGLPADERLLMAHCVAAAYVSNPEPLHPSLDQLRRFVARLGRAPAARTAPRST